MSKNGYLKWYPFLAVSCGDQRCRAVNFNFLRHLTICPENSTYIRTAKPPPPVQIRAAPPNSLRKFHSPVTCGRTKTAIGPVLGPVRKLCEHDAPIGPQEAAPRLCVTFLMDIKKAREIVISGHESAHAVASVRLGLPFEYVTLDDSEIGPHVQSVDNRPRPIAFYR